MQWRALLAMNNHQLGRHDAAVTELKKADELVDEYFSQSVYRRPNVGNGFDWEFASILRDEARALIDGSPTE